MTWTEYPLALASAVPYFSQVAAYGSLVGGMKMSMSLLPLPGSAAELVAPLALLLPPLLLVPLELLDPQALAPMARARPAASHGPASTVLAVPDHACISPIVRERSRVV